MSEGNFDQGKVSASDSENSRRGVLRSALGLIIAADVADLPARAIIQAADQSLPRGILKNEHSYVPLEPIAVEEKQVSLIGIRHTADTLATNGEKLAKQIWDSQSPFVVLEYFDDVVGARALPTDSIKRWGEQYKSSYPIRPGGYDDAVCFFAGMGSICAAGGKDIIVVNPQLQESPINRQAGTQKDFFTGVAAALGGGLVPSDIQQLWRRAFTKPIPRRNVLRGLGYSVSAAALGVSLTADSPQRLREVRDLFDELNILSADLPEEQKANVLSLSMLDWRDAMSALGIRKALESFGEEVPSESVSVIQGMGHNVMSEYLQRPNLAKAKRILYPYFNLGNPPK